MERRLKKYLNERHPEWSSVIFGTQSKNLIAKAALYIWRSFDLIKS